MIKSAASKVMWVGRATVFLIGLAVILALVFGVASTVSAHTGNKGFFHLGHKNVSKAVSTLIKQGPGPALSLVVQSGQPPLNVNSTGRVPRLNADMVDGKHANAFLPKGGKAANSDKLDNLDSTAFGQPTAFGMSNRITVPLTAGENYILIPALTPSASGKCLVTVSTQILGTANTSIGPVYRAAIKRGASVPVTDGLFGHYFQPFSGSLSSDMTRNAVFDVTGGEATQFGAYLSHPRPDWQGDNADVHVTYWCTTPGSGAAGASVSAEAKAEARTQENNTGN